MASTIQFLRAAICCTILLVAATMIVEARPQVSAGKIGIKYECDSSCGGCTYVEVQQSTCLWIPKVFNLTAPGYITYECGAGGQNVTAKLYLGIKALCSPKDPIHLTKHYPSETCVDPLDGHAGGHTWYTCPGQ